MADVSKPVLYVRKQTEYTAGNLAGCDISPFPVLPRSPSPRQLCVFLYVLSLLTVTPPLLGHAAEGFPGGEPLPTAAGTAMSGQRARKKEEAQ